MISFTVSKSQTAVLQAQVVNFTVSISNPKHHEDLEIYLDFYECNMLLVEPIDT